MSGFYFRNAFLVMFLTVISIDFVAMQTDFLNSLHLLSDYYRSAFNGWLGSSLLVAICIYPWFYYFLLWLRFIPLRIAAILQTVPYIAFGIWLANIAYLAALTEFDTVSMRLKPDLKFFDEGLMSTLKSAQSKGIPITVVYSSNGDFIWVNAKYAREGKELCKSYIDVK